MNFAGDFVGGFFSGIFPWIKTGKNPPYMREIGPMWRIGVLTGKPCTFLLKNWSFSAFSRYKNREGVSRGFDVELHIPPLALMPPKSLFLLEFLA